MIKRIIKRTLRAFGIEVRRYNTTNSAPARLAAMLASHQVNLVLDIGANTGQFGSELREAGYRGRIVSFEPLSSAWAELVERARGDTYWEIAPRAAIGSEDGEIDLHIAGNSQSSSVLEMLEAHSKAAPASSYIGAESVSLRPLDLIAAPFIRPDSNLFIKIDTQGYERDVLKGASELLNQALGVQMELSFVPLYANQALFDEMFAYLRRLGFELWDFGSVFCDGDSCRLLQGNGTFFRNREIAARWS